MSLAEEAAPQKCPSCQATDNNPYVNADGVKMRACGRCMIQWHDAKPAESRPKEFSESYIQEEMCKIPIVCGVDIEHVVEVVTTVDMTRIGWKNRVPLYEAEQRLMQTYPDINFTFQTRAVTPTKPAESPAKHADLTSLTD